MRFGSRDYVLYVVRSSPVVLFCSHYNDVIMTTIASQITSLAVVYSTVYSDADQRKHQSSASLAFVWGIHRDRWIPRKGQLRGKCFHLMTSSCVIEKLWWKVFWNSILSVFSWIYVQLKIQWIEICSWHPLLPLIYRNPVKLLQRTWRCGQLLTILNPIHRMISVSAQ